MTVLLDVIAVCRAEPDQPEPAIEEPAPEPAASSGLLLIHVAPSARLDPSNPEDVEIEQGDLGDEVLAGFIVD